MFFTLTEQERSVALQKALNHAHILKLDYEWGDDSDLLTLANADFTKFGFTTREEYFATIAYEYCKSIHEKYNGYLPLHYEMGNAVATFMTRTPLDIAPAIMVELMKVLVPIHSLTWKTVESKDRNDLYDRFMSLVGVFHAKLVEEFYNQVGANNSLNGWNLIALSGNSSLFHERYLIEQGFDTNDSSYMDLLEDVCSFYVKYKDWYNTELARPFKDYWVKMLEDNPVTLLSTPFIEGYLLYVSSSPESNFAHLRRPLVARYKELLDHKDNPLPKKDYLLLQRDFLNVLERSLTVALGLNPNCVQFDAMSLLVSLGVTFKEELGGNTYHVVDSFGYLTSAVLDNEDFCAKGLQYTLLPFEDYFKG